MHVMLQFRSSRFKDTYRVQTTRRGRDLELLWSGSIGALWLWLTSGEETACSQRERTGCFRDGKGHGQRLSTEVKGSVKQVASHGWATDGLFCSQPVSVLSQSPDSTDPPAPVFYIFCPFSLPALRAQVAVISLPFMYNSSIDLNVRATLKV